MALETGLGLFNREYNDAVFLPLINYMSRLYGTPIDSFTDFLTSFPLVNPPLQNLTPYVAAQKVSAVVDKKTNKQIISLQKAAVQRSKTERLKCLLPTYPFDSSYLKKKRFMKPVEFEGSMQALSSMIYTSLLTKPNNSAVLGRVVKSPDSSKRFYQLGELYIDHD